MTTTLNTLIDSYEYSRILASFLSINQFKVNNYLEFGCYTGTSLIASNEVFKFLNFNNVNYYAFDSFKGLPTLTENDDPTFFQEGMYSCDKSELINNLSTNKFPTDRFFLYEGFFKDAFNIIDKSKLPKFDIIMFDCDLYSSTIEALNFSVDFFSDNVILIFDDWNSSDEINGQQKALKKFLDNNKNLVFNSYIDYKYFGRDAGIITHISRT